MSVSKGRQAYIRRPAPTNERTIEEAEARDSGVSQGRLMFRARRGDHAARDLSERIGMLRDDPDGPPPAA